MEEEISLKELILIMLKEWKIIFSTTVIVIFISSVVVFAFNDISYTTTLLGNITKIESYDTSYGLYRTSIAKVDEQVNLVNNHEYKEYLDSKHLGKYSITPKIINGTDFQLNIQSSDESIAANVANDIIETFHDYLNYTLQSKALSYFLVLNDINIRKLDETSMLNQSLLDAYRLKLEGVQPVLQPSIINPAYQVLTEEITRLEINEISNLATKSQLENAVDILNNQSYGTFIEYLGSKNRFEQVSVSMSLSNNVTTISTKQFEPLLTISIAVLLGIMIGVFIAFFKNYWQNS